MTGEERTLGERAVADFAAVQAADATGFTDGEGREVVVEDEALGDFAAGVAVEVLRFVAGSERGQAERLGFAARRRARSRASAGAGRLRRRAGGFRSTPRPSLRCLLVEDRGAERLDLDLIEGGADVERRWRRDTSP